MSYKTELENFLNLQTYKLSCCQKTAALLYCPECCQTNCHYKCQLKTIFVLANWFLQLLSS